MSQVNLRIDGTSCRHCVSAVHHALESIEGVEVTLVQPCSALIRYSESGQSVDEILDAIRDEGFALGTHASHEGATV